MTVAGADEVSVDRAVAAVVERLAGAGDGIKLNGSAAAAVDLARVGENAVAGAVEDDAGATGAADLSVVADGRGAGDVDSPHALDDRARTVADLPASAQHHRVAAADVELRAGQHIDRHVGAAGLRSDPARHGVGLVAVASDRLPGGRVQRRRAGGTRRRGRAAERGRGQRQSGSPGT